MDFHPVYCESERFFSSGPVLILPGQTFCPPRVDHPINAADVITLIATVISVCCRGTIQHVYDKLGVEICFRGRESHPDRRVWSLASASILHLHQDPKAANLHKEHHLVNWASLPVLAGRQQNQALRLAFQEAGLHSSGSVPLESCQTPFTGIGNCRNKR
jgi:hypothetical protein